MTTGRLTGLAGIVTVCALLATPAAQAQDADGAVKYRQGVMKANAGHAGALAQIAKGKVAHTDHLASHADALAALSRMVIAAFETEAGIGDSRAKAEIWSDRSGFEAKAKDFERAAAALAEASRGSDPEMAGAKLGDVFDTCKACHKEYRKEKE